MTDQLIHPAAELDRPTVGIVPAGDRFEDFHDRIGVSLVDLRDSLTSTWLFNYVKALRAAGLHSVVYFFSARVTGVVRFTHPSSGAGVCVLPTPWAHRKLQGLRDRLGIETPVFGSVLSYAATPWLALTAEVSRDRCAAVLCQEYESARFDEAVLWGRAVGIHVFATYQGGDTRRTLLERLVRYLTIRCAAGLVIGSHTEADRVRTAYGVPTDRIATIPNAVDVDEWRIGDRQSARELLDIPGDVPVVAWHGRVQMDTKGLDVLLDAWERVEAAWTGAQPLLVLVGSGGDSAALRRRLASFPSSAVRWDDQWIRDPSVIRRYLSAADVSVMSSRREGFPVAVIEAMACGRPVVATDVSGVRDALGDDPGGVIVPKEDADALASALSRVLGDEMLRQVLSERARRRAEQEFSLAAVGGRLRTFMHRRGAFGEKGHEGAGAARAVR
jgi:starch synthase